MCWKHNEEIVESDEQQGGKTGVTAAQVGVTGAG